MISIDRLQADKVTRLMGCLCYTKRLASSPYADLLAESQWSAIAQEFVRQCCGLMGLVSSPRCAVASVVTPAHVVHADSLVILHALTFCDAALSQDSWCRTAAGWLCLLAFT